MGISSSLVQSEGLIRFRRLSTDVSLDDIEIPERPENRRPTNSIWLKILGVFILVFLPFMIYTLYYSDIDRIIKGYDNCGNVCGKNNYHWDNIPCSGKNWTLYPCLQYDETFELLFQGKHCIQSCQNEYTVTLGNDYEELNTFSGSDSTKTKYNFDISGVKWQLTISCLFSILVAIGMLFVFRYALAFVVWSILIGCYLGLIIIIVILWYCFLTAPDNGDGYRSQYQVLSIIFTIAAMISGLVLLWCRKRIKLVIMLLKETTKAVFDMPGLITLPVICVLVIVILTTLFGITMFAMSSSGTLQRFDQDFYDYALDPIMIFTMIYNFLIYLWLTQFFTGIQYMVIAGAVSKWYFSRDKTFLGSPIFKSASIAFRYHLGTVALGGIIITLIQVIKTIILGLINSKKLRFCIERIVDTIETFFKFLSKNAYIITAIHGEPFITSGKRAANLIFENVKDVVAINYVGDFILGMAKVLIVVITLLISMAIFAIAPGDIPESNIVAFVIIGIVSTLVACVSFGVFETTIDTLFICYCEDQVLNDGMARPYFMSRNLMEFVQNSKDVYGKK